MRTQRAVPESVLSIEPVRGAVEIPGVRFHSLQRTTAGRSSRARRRDGRSSITATSWPILPTRQVWSPISI